MSSRPGLALAAGAALAALIYDPAAPAAAPKTAILSLLSLTLLVVSLTRREKFRHSRSPARGEEPEFKPGWPTTLWLTLCGWGALSLLWGDHTAGGLPALAAWSAAGGLMLVLHRLEQPLRVELARRLALLVGSAAAAAAVLQWLLGARGIGVHGGQGNPNWLGLLLAVTVPICIGEAQRRPWVTLAVLLQLAGLILSGSRVAWLSLAITGLVAIGFHRRERARAGLGGEANAVSARRQAVAAGANKKLRWMALAGAVLGLALVVLLAARSGKPLPEAWRGRAQIWRCSAQAALAAAPLGVGVGGFGHAFLEEQGGILSDAPPKEAARRFLNATTAHNDYLHVAVEGGPVGALLLIMTFVLTVARGLGAKAVVGERKEEEGGGGAASRALPEPKKRSWPAGAWAALALALTALGDSPLQQPAVLIMLAVLLPALATEASGPVWLSGRPGRAVVLALIAVLLAPSAARWLGHRLAAPATNAVLDRRLVILERASRVDPWSGALSLELGLAHLALGQPDRALVELERSTRRLANVGTRVALGNARLGLGRVRSAIKAYRAALSWHPGLFRARANLAEALRRNGELDEAARHLRVAKSLLPGHPKLPALERRLSRSRIELESNDISGD